MYYVVVGVAESTGRRRDRAWVSFSWIERPVLRRWMDVYSTGGKRFFITLAAGNIRD